MGDCESTYHSEINTHTQPVKACENWFLVVFVHVWLIFKEVWLLLSHSPCVIVVSSLFSFLSSVSFFALREILSWQTHQHTVPSSSTYTFFFLTDHPSTVCAWSFLHWSYSTTGPQSQHKTSVVTAALVSFLHIKCTSCNFLHSHIECLWLLSS